MASNIASDGSDDCSFCLRRRLCRWKRQDARESRPRLLIVAGFEEELLPGYHQIRGQGSYKGKR